jgi:hypothetical protein
MPRVILRTVEPAKVEACQSAEKRCTRLLRDLVHLLERERDKIHERELPEDDAGDPEQ